MSDANATALLAKLAMYIFLRPDGFSKVDMTQEEWAQLAGVLRVGAASQNAKNPQPGEGLRVLDT